VKEKTPKNACFIPDTALPHLRSDHVTSTDHIPPTITLTEDSQNFSKEENDTTTGSPQTYPTIFATLTILRYSSDSPIRPTTPPIRSTIPRYTRRSSKDTSGIAALIDIPEHVIGTRTAYPSAPRNVSRPLAPRTDLPDFVDRASHRIPFHPCLFRYRSLISSSPFRSTGSTLASVVLSLRLSRMSYPFFFIDSLCLCIRATLRTIKPVLLAL